MSLDDVTQPDIQVSARTLLHINTSLFGSLGHSSLLADHFVARWRSQQPEATVIVRDLAAEPVPHLTLDAFLAYQAKPEARSLSEMIQVAYSDGLIDELRRADVIVIGLPMYNFGIPSVLKAYFDHVSRAGVTFRYGEGGPEGLLVEKQAYLFAARGGFYADTPADTQAPYVRQVLGFLGIDVEIVVAEGLAISGRKEIALRKAMERIDALLPEQALAA